MKREYSVVFWLNQPPKVEVGAYNYVSRNVLGHTYYVCAHDLPDDRKALGWDKTNYSKAELLVLPNEIELRYEIINDLIKKDNVIHIVCGLRGSIADEICPILKKNNVMFYVVSERPSIAFNSLKNTIHSFGVMVIHRIRYYQYRKSVIAFLALGKLGVSSFHRIGWPYEKLFRFMYCGEYDLLNRESFIKNDNKVKFLYIGRFKYKTHAVDVLQKAFDSQINNNWQLDMAGGYGDDKDKVLSWIKANPNAFFLGKIDSSKVRELMSKYDVVLVPSRADGWNCQVNEALSVGVPVITTKESVSGELIENSGAGIVVKNASVSEFSNAIKTTLNDKNIINEWKNKLDNYSGSFSPSSVGEYLLSIIDYTSGNNNDMDRPVCPW